MGTLEKALERHPLSVKHNHPLPLLNMTFGEVLGYPSNVNKTRIPSRRKCSQQVSSMHVKDNSRIVAHGRETNARARIGEALESLNSSGAQTNVNRRPGGNFSRFARFSIW